MPFPILSELGHRSPNSVEIYGDTPVRQLFFKTPTEDSFTGFFQTLAILLLTIVVSECLCLFLIHFISRITWNSFYEHFPPEVSLGIADMLPEEDGADDEKIKICFKFQGDLDKTLLTKEWTRVACIECNYEDDKNSENHMCAICLCTYEENDSVSKSKFCEHVFHTECYKEWLSGLQKTCPYCRCSVLDESTKLKYISHEYEDFAYESYVLNKFVDFLMMIGIGI